MINIVVIQHQHTPRDIFNFADLCILGKAATGEVAFTLIKALIEDNNTIDAILIDAELPDMSGQDLAAKLLQQHPQLAIFILMPALEGVTCDVRGYLPAHISQHELFRVLSLGKAEHYETNTSLSTLFDTLTVRERDIVQGILQGDSIQAIANALNLSPNTIRAFCQRICFKLNVNNIRELIILASQHNLIKPPGKNPD